MIGTLLRDLDCCDFSGYAKTRIELDKRIDKTSKMLLVSAAVLANMKF